MSIPKKVSLVAISEPMRQLGPTRSGLGVPGIHHRLETHGTTVELGRQSHAFDEQPLEMAIGNTGTFSRPADVWGAPGPAKQSRSPIHRVRGSCIDEATA